MVPRTTDPVGPIRPDRIWESSAWGTWLTQREAVALEFAVTCPLRVGRPTRFSQMPLW
jgi:hypothetical protein